jgi:hypothetical protein
LKRLLAIALSLVVSVLLFANAARAQWDGWGEDDPFIDPVLAAPRWDIHGGVAFLAGDSADDSTYIIGLNYQWPLGSYEGGSQSWMAITADVIPIETLTTGDEQLVSFLINYKRYAAVSGTRVYTMLGAGARWASGNIPELEIQEDFDFGWGVRVGLDFDQSMFVQGGFLGGPNPGDDGMWTVEIGVRF